MCEFVAIMLSDPDGLPSTPEGMQRSAEVILEEMGADFATQYQETLDGGPLAAQERYMARLRPNRAKPAAIRTLADETTRNPF